MRWFEPSLLTASVGLAISIYLTIEHYTSSALLACPESGTINCRQVTTSKWSHIVGIPVAVLGLGYFVAMMALLVPPAWQRQELDRLRIAWSGIGVAVALYLVWVELFRVNAICLWCTAVHICTLLTLGAILWRVSTPPK